MRDGADWFSGLRLWQKAAFGVGFGVVTLTLLLLPRGAGAVVVISALFSTMVLSFWNLRRWQRILLIGLLTAVLVLILLETLSSAPYLGVAVAVAALALSVVRGWMDASSLRQRH